MPKSIAIIGGGAAGFFSAINIAKKNPNYNITIYEASNKLLSKVLISGGGRCNVTNRISEPKVLANNYPRGYDFLEPVFEQFSTLDTQKWFSKHGVKLKTELDGRVFPVTDSSETIYNCLYQNCIELGVNVKLKHRLVDLNFNQGEWYLKFKTQHETSDIVILATGINTGILNMLEKLSLPIIQPVPSLFTFNSKNHRQ
jgi:predicted Rossmann fold flavoprotein